MSFNALKYDLFRYKDVCSFKNQFLAILTHPGARFMLMQRACNVYSGKNPLGIFFRIWRKLLSKSYNIEIPHTTKLGKGLYFGHFKNIIINQSSEIGNNCNICQGVTIGRESRGKKMGSPTILNQVYIGANSVIVGNIEIGNNVLIAPLTFVNFDVPDNAVVLGNPAKIISYSGSKGYIKKTLNT